MKRAAAVSALLVLCSSLLMTGLIGGPALDGADAQSRDDDTPIGRAERVLVFSVPTLTWRDFEQVDLPNLRSVLEKGSIANLSVRSVNRRTPPGDAYATLNAGTRTRGTRLASLAFVAGINKVGRSDPDGDPVEVPPGAFENEDVAEPGSEGAVITAPEKPPIDPSTLPPEAGETYDGTPAAEEFARRTGVTPSVGSVFNFGLVSILELNDRLLFGTEVGALGRALGEAGVGRAVIANGDHGSGLDDLDFRREASLGLMDPDGLVERGRVGRTLLEDSSKAPFGTRYDISEVSEAFEEFYDDNTVVLVEASDMVRAEEAKELSTPEQQIRLRRAALVRSDRLLGTLMEEVDPETDAVMVIAPYSSGYGNGLTAIGVVAPDVSPGLLFSGTTRRDGFVQTVDIAPTIASLMGAKIPTTMEGTVIESAPKPTSLAERAEWLDETYRAAVFRDATVGPASAVFVFVQLFLWAAAVFAMTRGSKRLRSAVQVAALSILAYLPMTFLAGAFPFHHWGSAAYWAFVIGLSVVLGVACYLPTRRYLADPLITALALIVGFLSADIVTGGQLQFNTVFGYTPTVAGRFDGMGNPAFSMFTAAAIMLAGLLAFRIGGRRGAWAGVVLLVWTVLLDGAPIWGADVGGALTLVPSVGVTALMLLGIRVKLRAAIGLAVGAIGVVLALGFLDLMRPPASRTHLGRLLSDIGDNGFGAFETVVLRKLNANLSVLAGSVWTLMLPVVFIFIGLIFWKAPWRLQTISERIPQERAAVAGLSVAMVLGFALNDSGIAIPGMMLGVVSASLVHLMLRVDDEDEDMFQAVLSEGALSEGALSEGGAVGGSAVRLGFSVRRRVTIGAYIDTLVIARR